ncbi:MAG: Calx-beta domain-containing protein [Verrucomicrobiales bacterium]|nr:Calx-beta domain-containing protein [Verrucomicrobiales bacterium]
MKTPFLFLCAGFLAFASLPAVAQVSVLTYHNDNRRTGLNANETILNLTNVNSATFGKLFSYAVDGYVYAQPLYVPNVAITGQGTHNVLFIATEHNTVYALDPDAGVTGNALLWKTNLGVSAVTVIIGVFTNKDFGTRYSGGAYTDIMPEVGITGTPVIDINSGTLYVDVFTGEESGSVTNYFHRLHALNIADGTERSFSPVVVTASVPGTGRDSVGGIMTFNPKQENQRPALTLAGGIVYVAFAGYADTDPYHGWVIGFNATNLVQLTNYVFNTTPNSTTAAFGANAAEAGIWMAGGGLSVDDSTNLYFEVGNGSFNATNGSGGTEYGDSFIKLSTTNGLAVADYFTPWNQANLALNDTDLGSGGLLLLPDQPGTYPHLLLGAGKEGKIYVINRDQFTTGNNHYNTSGSFDSVAQSVSGQIGGSFDTPAYFNGQIYYAGSGNKLKAFSVTSGVLSSTPVSTGSRTYGFPGATPVVSANGTNSGIVWALQMGSPQLLVACNATNFTTELYNSGQAAGNRDKLASGVKFAAPVVADGKVFVGSSNSVSVFGLLAGTFSFSPAAYSVQESNTTATITVNRIGGTNGAVQVSYATVAGGTATGGVDYTDVSGVLNWTNGESAPKTFTVPVLNDGLAEPDETVNLALSNPTNGASALGLQSTAVLTIIEPPTSVWKLAHFGANANNAAIAGDTANPDQDGSVNLLEYAFATDPNVANSNSFTGSLVGQQFQLHFPRNTSASDITYFVQSSGTLMTWSNLMTYTAASGWVTNLAGTSVSESPSNGVPPDQYVNVTVITSTNVTAAGSTNQFLRLEVNR